MAHNVSMPLFGRASGMDWTDMDTFDVDLLAECLLDDGNQFNGVTFDFNLGSNKYQNTLISPENSEDGNLPPLGDVPQNLNSNLQPSLINTMLPTQQAQQVQSIQALAQLASTGTMNPMQMNFQQHIQSFQGMTGIVNSLQQNQVPPVGQTMVYHDHSIVPDMKRQRVDAPAPLPMMQMPTVVAPMSGLLNVQQLAAAAMQQGRGRKKSQAQIDRRRERNRILARRTRLRKKFFFESLQKEVMDLQRENLWLKGIVREEMQTEEGRRILEECDAAEKMPPAVLEACGEGENGLDLQDYNLVQSIQQSQHSFIITDPSLADNPIVFASDDFLNLTGYSREQVLGRNCRFLQGTDTSLESVQHIRKCLVGGEDVSITLINYMADGTPFWNRLFIAALRDAQNNVVNFIGVIVKIPGPGENDDDGDYSDQED